MSGEEEEEAIAVKSCWKEALESPRAQHSHVRAVLPRYSPASTALRPKKGGISPVWKKIYGWKGMQNELMERKGQEEGGQSCGGRAGKKPLSSPLGAPEKAVRKFLFLSLMEIDLPCHDEGRFSPFQSSPQSLSGGESD